LEADKYTRAVLAECPERALNPETAAEYRRVYTRLTDEGVTAWDKASSQQHWNKLRTATRWAMAEDIRAWRKASEDARKGGDLARAQHCTAEAWRLAVALDAQFLAASRQAWAAKAKALKAAGERPVDKSKRRTSAPTADTAPCALLDQRHRGARLAERHAERLALLALTGCRPAELMAGVGVRLLRDKHGKPSGVGVEIQGAKVDAQRGHARRRLVFALAGGGTAVRGLAQVCAERGGGYTLATTPADYRSLNRALQTHGLSCYAFRHAVGSDLKAAIATGKTTAEQAAAVMGHRSTASLLSYGTRRRGRGGQRPRAGVSGQVKNAAVSRTARAKARAQAKAKAVSVGATPAPSRTRLRAPQTPLARGLRPRLH
jgi:integrase